jgi:hypothetical protein
MGSQESTRFPCVQVACDTPLKGSRQGLQLWFRLHPDQRSTPEVIVPQSYGTPALAISGLPRQKAIWMPLPWSGAEYIIWRKVMASPQVRAVVSLVSLELPVACLSTKGVLKTKLTNLLIGLMQDRASN